MGILIWVAKFLAVTLASYLINKALAPRVKGPREQDFQAPTATAGIPLPVWWGTAEVAPNIVWWGNLQKNKYKQWMYHMCAQVMLGWGVVNEIVDISFSDKSCRNWHLIGGGDPVIDGPIPNEGAPVDFNVNGDRNGRGGDHAHSMFGGNDSGGGIGANPGTSSDDGHLVMYWGFDDATAQPADTYLNGSAGYPGYEPHGTEYSGDMRWPNYAYLRMGTSDAAFYIAAGDGTPKPMKLLLRRTAWWDKDNTGALSPLGQTAEQATIRYDANPAEILYDLLTHPGYGLGRDPSRLDLDSFTACAAALRDEEITDTKSGFGITVTLTRPTDASTVIRDILNTIDATLCTNPVTGQLRLKLIRPDYDPDTLLQLDASNTSNVKYSPSTWKETINEVRLSYKRFINTTEKRGYVDDMISDQDLSNYQSTGRIRSLSMDLPYITDPDVAALACARLRRVNSVPLARVSWQMNRAGFALMQGDAVKMDLEAYGVTGLILRVTNINYGTLEDGHIEVDGVQDVFSVTRATTVVPASGWTEPTGTSTDESGAGAGIPDAAAGITWGAGFYTP